MESPFFVKNHRKNIRKTFSLRKLFDLLFVTSLGFNVYFLAFQSGSISLDNEYISGVGEEKINKERKVGLQAVALNREFEDSGLTTNIHEKDPTYKVEKVLFDSSAESNDSNIQALKLKVRNSLNYTVCQEKKLKNECGSFAAHLGRLLAWFLDVNREMRDGDVLNVLYERLNNKSQFKILQLTYKSNYIKEKRNG